MSLIKKIIIHIGYHKTGTSWFQKTYFKLHPEFHLINRKFIQKHILKPSSYSFNSKEVKALFLKEVHDVSSDVKYFVISEEELTGNPHSGGKGGYY